MTVTQVQMAPANTDTPSTAPRMPEIAPTRESLQIKPQAPVAPSHGTHRVTISSAEGNSMSHDGATRITADDLMGEGILGTARNNGFVTNNITPKSVVNTPQGEMTVEMAHRFGLVGKGQTGEYYELTNEQVTSVIQDSTNEQNIEPDTDSMPQQFNSRESVEALNTLEDNLHESFRDGLFNKTVDNMVTAPSDDEGNPIGVDLKDFAAQAGMSEDQFKSTYEGVIDGFQEQADSVLSSNGVDPGEFYDWMQNSRSEELRLAMKQHFYTRNPSVWKSHVDQFRREVAPNDEALEAAGVSVTKRDGNSLITIQGMQMTVAAAARAGLI